MRPLTQIIVFSLLMLSVMGASNYYLWRKLVRDAELPNKLKHLATGLLILPLLAVPATFALIRNTPQEQLAPLALYTYTWMGLLSSLFALLVLSDLGGLLARWGRRLLKQGETTNQVDPAKRRLLRRAVAGGVALGGTTLTGVGLAQARGLALKKVEISLDRLPSTFDGFTIVQMSDIHVGPTIGQDFISELVRRSNELAPDLVAITGDLVDGSVEHLGRHTAPLAELRSKYGTVFVTGNHEYYSGVDEWVNELARIGIPTLRNESRRIEKEGESFLLAGITDYRAGRYGDAPDMKRALAQRRTGEEVVLLAHQPRAFSEAAELDVGLQLSGHTHGGQFWPWSWVIHLIEPVVSGWAQKKRTQIYVSCGTGYWGPPVRLGTEAEITLITLRAGAAAPPSAATVSI